jgi:hypothetical protein
MTGFPMILFLFLVKNDKGFRTVVLNPLSAIWGEGASPLHPFTRKPTDKLQFLALLE